MYCTYEEQGAHTGCRIYSMLGCFVPVSQAWEVSHSAVEGEAGVKTILKICQIFISATVWFVQGPPPPPKK